MKFQLSTRQICLFFIAFLPISKLFMFPSIVAGASGEDLWLSAIINCVLDLLTLTTLLSLCKYANCNFYQMTENLLGKVGSKILFFLYFIFFMLKAILPINEQKDYVEFTLYTLLSTTFYFLPFFIVAFYLCTKKLRVVGRISDVMWVATLIGFFLLITLSVSNADFMAILPIGAKGTRNILKGSFFSLNWFGDCVYLLFFAGEFAYKKKDGIKIILSYLAGLLMVIIFLIIFYCIFTSIAQRQRFALTEISKYTTVINNTGRFDYIAILFILLSNIFCLSTPLFFATRLLERIIFFKKKWIAPLIVIGIQLFISVFLSNYFASIEYFLINFGGIYFIIFSNVLPIFSLFLIKKEKNFELQKN